MYIIPINIFFSMYIIPIEPHLSRQAAVAAARGPLQARVLAFGHPCVLPSASPCAHGTEMFRAIWGLYRGYIGLLEVIWKLLFKL